MSEPAVIWKIRKASCQRLRSAVRPGLPDRTADRKLCDCVVEFRADGGTLTVGGAQCELEGEVRIEGLGPGGVLLMETTWHVFNQLLLTVEEGEKGPVELLIKNGSMAAGGVRMGMPGIRLGAPRPGRSTTPDDIFIPIEANPGAALARHFSMPAGTTPPGVQAIRTLDDERAAFDRASKVMQGLGVYPAALAELLVSTHRPGAPVRNPPDAWGGRRNK